MKESQQEKGVTIGHFQMKQDKNERKGYKKRGKKKHGKREKEKKNLKKGR